MKKNSATNTTMTNALVINGISVPLTAEQTTAIAALLASTQTVKTDVKTPTAETAAKRTKKATETKTAEPVKATETKVETTAETVAKLPEGKYKYATADFAEFCIKVKGEVCTIAAQTINGKEVKVPTAAWKCITARLASNGGKYNKTKGGFVFENEDAAKKAAKASKAPVTAAEQNALIADWNKAAK